MALAELDQAVVVRMLELWLLLPVGIACTDAGAEKVAGAETDSTDHCVVGKDNAIKDMLSLALILMLANQETGVTVAFQAVIKAIADRRVMHVCCKTWHAHA